MTLEERVRAELLAIRKTADGMTVATLSASPVTCGLLGNGDPLVAYNAIKHLLLDADADTALSAAMSSLGLSSDQATHLGRLEEFGFAHHYDQRQVRRYSDKGIRQLARSIATHWATISVPQLDVTVVQTGPDTVEAFARSRHHYYIEMRPLRTTVRGNDGVPNDLDLAPTTRDDGLWLSYQYPNGIQLAVKPETSLTLVWAGELWPKYAVQLIGPVEQLVLTTESLGSKLMLTVSRLP